VRLETIVGIYLPERGYPTPKVDVRAGVFNDRGDVLLVQEASDGLWALPGRGRRTRHAEAACGARCRESGTAPRSTRRRQRPLDASLHAAPPGHHKLLFLCSLDGGTASSIETTAASFFPLDALPICPSAAHFRQTSLLSAHRSHPELCYFD
jgi:ADP-ribose pyrophosphatase YjhB (NUDIX family)